MLFFLFSVKNKHELNRLRSRSEALEVVTGGFSVQMSLLDRLQLFVVEAGFIYCCYCVPLLDYCACGPRCLF